MRTKLEEQLCLAEEASRNFGGSFIAFFDGMHSNQTPVEINTLYNQARLAVSRDQQHLGEKLYQLILRLSPKHTPSLNNLGILLAKREEPHGALEYFQTALEVNPQDPIAWNNLGKLLGQLNRYPDAVSAHQQAILFKPDYANAYNNLGCMQEKLNQPSDAIESFKHAIALDENLLSAYSNLGHTLRMRDRFDESVEVLNAALEKDPEHLDTLINLGTTLQEQNQVEQAIALFRRAIALSPNDALAHWDLSLCLLISGDLRNGYREYEWRWQREDYPACPRKFTQKAWQGEPLNGKSILLHSEQGLGDVLQFIRYATNIKALGARVFVEVPSALQGLIREMDCFDAVLLEGEPEPLTDFQCPLISLPLVFGTEMDTIPAVTPYLSVNTSRSDKWAQLLGQKKSALRIGIVWAGSPSHTNDKNRSCPLSYFQTLGQSLDIELIALQKGYGLIQAKETAEIRLLNHELQDFSDTAAAAAQMDLIICVDTSVAHLAGALNLETWLLLPYSPDARWFLERDDSPWYPSIRLFRQKSFRDWECVFSDVKTALIERLSLAH